MAKKPAKAPRIDRVRLRDDAEKKQVVIEIDLFNELDRTAHLHATPRIVQYDAASGHLMVELSDEHINRELPATSLRRPKFKAIDPQKKSTMRVRLPRIMHRLGPGADTRVPGIETLHIHEATDIEVTVAWSDTPFYPDPRKGAKTTKASALGVLEWQQGTLHGRSRARP